MKIKSRNLWQASVLLFMFALTSSKTFAAFDCSIDVTNSWGSGAIANFVIANNGSSSTELNSFSIEFFDESRIASAWDLTASGSNPYTLTPKSHNSTIDAGSSRSYGFQLSGSLGTYMFGGDCGEVVPPPPENSAPDADLFTSVSGHDLYADASLSEDPDGDSLSFSWILGDDTPANSAVVTHTYANGGRYSVVVTVDDGELTDVAAKSVFVADPPNEPQGLLDCQYVMNNDFDGGHSAQLFVTNIGDEVLKGWVALLTYEEGFGHTYPGMPWDGAENAFVVFNRSNLGLAPGETIAESVIVDALFGMGSNDPHPILGGMCTEVEEPTNLAPNASFRNSVNNTLTVSFDATLSDDPNGDPLSYSWDFGDGSSSTQAIIDHSYAVAGEYQVTLTVSDGELTDSTSRTVSAGDDETNTPPVITEVSCEEIRDYTIFCIPRAEDAENNSIRFTYDWGDGSELEESVTSMAHEYEETGNYTVTITASDGLETNSVSVEVVVSEPPQTGATCEYEITGGWGNSFQGQIVITNVGDEVINAWSVSWEYSGGSSISNLWNASLTGNNPYTATAFNWNGTIEPGQSRSIGFQGNNGSAGTEIPDVTGSICIN